MLSIVMDKAAKEKFHAVRKTHKVLKENGKSTTETTSMQPTVAPPQTQSANVDRQELIRNAMDIYQEKSKVFDSLSKKEKQRLKLLAMHTMMGKGETWT